MPNVEKVYEHILKILDELVDAELESVSMDTSIEELNLDSLDKVQVLIALKREFGVEITAEHLTDTKKVTIGDLCHHICNAASIRAV